MNLKAALQPARNLVLTAALLVAALAFTAPLEAQTVRSSPVIKDIRVEYEGGAGVSEERILSQMSLKVGDPYSVEKSDQDIRTLVTSGDVENVRFREEPLGNGIRLVVVVKTRSLLGGVSFRGNSAYSADTLRDEANLAVGASIDGAALAEARTAIQDLYRKEGFGNVAVSYNLTAPNAQGYSTVVFTVDEGVQGALRKISFAGNEAFSEGELREVMATQPKGRLAFWRKGVDDPETLQDDLFAIQDLYKTKGYLDAQILSSQWIPVENGKKDLVITIDEGPQYTVDSIEVVGVTKLPMEDITPFLRSSVGDLYDQSNVDADLALIRDQYGVKGYVEASADAQVLASGANSVRLEYLVREGEQFFLGKINIEGNYVTRDKVIRREILNQPGELFDTVKLDATRSRLVGMNYFSAVDVFPEDTLEPGVKDLTISLQEKSTGQVNFGAGFSSIDDLVGFIDITQANFDIRRPWRFTGGGQRFRASLRYGTERRDFVVSLIEPYFLDYRLEAGVEAFYRDLLFLSDFYDQTNYGGSFSLRRPVSDFFDLRLEYLAQSVEIDAEPDASPEIAAEEGDYFQSKIGLELIRETRDSQIFPTRGHRIVAGVDYSGLGGDVDTYGFSIGGGQYFSLPWRTIFSISGEYNSVDGDDVPIFERVFLGGANNLRGFDFRDVGPKDSRGEPLGGLSSWYITAEYTFPLIPQTSPNQPERIRGALFYDMGAVSEDAWDFSTDYNSNWGVGVRLYILNGAPVRIDYGIPIDSDEFNDSGGRFNITFGYRF